MNSRIVSSLAAVVFLGLALAGIPDGTASEEMTEGDKPEVAADSPITEPAAVEKESGVQQRDGTGCCCQMHMKAQGHEMGCAMMAEGKEGMGCRMMSGDKQGMSCGMTAEGQQGTGCGMMAEGKRGMGCGMMTEGKEGMGCGLMAAGEEGTGCAMMPGKEQGRDDQPAEAAAE